jgi:hypothetical protein
MESSKKPSPFGKLKGLKYIIIEVLMNVEYDRALNFLWKVNKEGRTFLLNQARPI